MGLVGPVIGGDDLVGPYTFTGPAAEAHAVMDRARRAGSRFRT